jgi:hypothetical protein
LGKNFALKTSAKRKLQELKQLKPWDGMEAAP